jgi:predicted LPLAT superfamily acyltransferase
LADKKSSWRGKTGGGNFGQLALFQYFRYGSISFAYCIMSCAIFFYLIINYKATRNIYFYFRSKHRYSIFKSAISTYRNHYLFGKTLIDKFAFFAGKRDKYSVDLINNEYFTELDSDVNRGALLLQSHVGSSELAGYFFSQNSKVINAIIFGGESPVFQEYRSKLLTGHNVRLIPVTDGFSEVFEINNALGNNDFVSMTADRIYEGSKNIELNFLGAKAEFPLGPFQIAVKLHVPVLALFVMQNGYKKYCCHVFKIEALKDETVDTKTQIEMLAQKYVSTLEQIVKKYPLQWYNFHKFWL